MPPDQETMPIAGSSGSFQDPAGFHVPMSYKDKSVPSTDSGYGSLDSLTADEDQSSSTASFPDNLIRERNDPPDSKLKGPCSETPTAADKAQGPTRTPTAKLPIDLDTHRAIRKIVSSFKTGFGRPLLRYLNSRRKIVKDPNEHAIAIFPSPTVQANGHVYLDVIVQCHPLAEKLVRQFMQESRLAIEASLFCTRGETQLMGVKLCVVSKEVNFLFSVYGQEPVTSGSALGRCGEPLQVISASETSKMCTLGGYISLGTGPNTRSWFGITTSHGFEAPGISSDGLQKHSSSFGLTLEVLQGLEEVWHRQVATNYNKLSSDLVKCMRILIQFEKSARRPPQVELQPVLEPLLLWLRSVLSSSAGNMSALFWEDQHSIFASLQTQLEVFIKKLPPSRGPDDEESHEAERIPKYHKCLGRVFVTSSEPNNIKRSREEGNLDWALIQFSGYNYVSVSDDVTRMSPMLRKTLSLVDQTQELSYIPTSNSNEVAGTYKHVIILNRRQDFPQCQVSPQPAYICIPPGQDFTEVISCTVDDPLGLSPEAARDIFLPGDSGSWAIGVDENNQQHVHGQLVATNSLGEALLVPMDAVLEDIKAKLHLLRERKKTNVLAYLPHFTLERSFLPNNKGEIMPIKEQMLTWKLAKLNWDAAFSKWERLSEKTLLGKSHFDSLEEDFIYIPEVHRTAFKEQKRAWEAQREDWDAELRDWTSSRGQKPLISLDWYWRWKENRRCWENWLDYDKINESETFGMPCPPTIRQGALPPSSSSSMMTGSHRSIWSRPASYSTTYSSNTGSLRSASSSLRRYQEDSSMSPRAASGSAHGRSSSKPSAMGNSSNGDKDEIYNPIVSWKDRGAVFPDRYKSVYRNPAAPSQQALNEQSASAGSPSEVGTYLELLSLREQREIPEDSPSNEEQEEDRW
jgi:hypothetical protein